MDAAAFAFAALVFVLAGIVKGVAGLGLPTVAMGLLTLQLPAAQAAGLLLLPSLVTNVWQALAGPALRALARRLAGLWAGTVVGTLWSVLPALGSTSPGTARAALGAVLVAYGAWGLAGPRLRLAPRHERWVGPLAGYATGAVTAATGVFVVPAVPYLQSLGLARDETVQALGLCFTVSTLALALLLARSAELPAAQLGLSALALAPAMAGLAVGGRLRRRIGEAAFRRFLFATLIALGASMALPQLLR